MTKKIIVSLFAVIFAFSLVGCGMNSKDNGNKNNNMGDTLSDIASGVTDKTGMTSSTAKITSEEAKAAALKDAGLTEADVTNLTTDLDRDDGVLKYEVDFHSGGVEYDYDINAETGKIISVDKDHD